MKKNELKNKVQKLLMIKKIKNNIKIEKCCNVIMIIPSEFFGDTFITLKIVKDYQI